MDPTSLSPNPGSVVTLFRNVSIWIQSSPQRTQSFLRHVKLANIEPNDLTVILYGETHCNSSYCMLVRIKRLRVPLTTFLASEKFHNFFIEETDWAQLCI